MILLNILLACSDKAEEDTDKLPKFQKAQIQHLKNQQRILKQMVPMKIATVTKKMVQMVLVTPRNQTQGIGRSMVLSSQQIPVVVANHIRIPDRCYYLSVAKP